MNIAIVGAGLLGRLIAWRLFEENPEKPLSITLIDKDVSGTSSAAYVAAAMVAPMSELIESESVVADKGFHALDIWQQWSDQLQQTYQKDIAYSRRGSLVVAHHADRGDLNRFVRSLTADLEKTKIPQSALKHCQREELRKLEPALLENFSEAYWLEQEGVLDNHGLIDSLYAVLKSKGARFVEQVLTEQDLVCLSSISNYNSAFGLERHDENVFSVDELNQADLIINCLGFLGKSSLPQQCKSFRGVRGEVLRVKAYEVDLSRPVRLMHPRYQLYIAPKPNHEYVIGATQIESESEHPITIRSSMELLSALYSVDKGFAEAEVLASDARCRPAFSDNLPAIALSESFDDVDSTRPKILSVNGLYRHGYLLSPVVVQQVLKCLSSSSGNIGSPLQGGEGLWPELLVS